MFNNKSMVKISKIIKKLKAHFNKLESIKIAFIQRGTDYATSFNKGSAEASGYDLVAYIGEYIWYNELNHRRTKVITSKTKIPIPPKSRISIPTGVRMELPSNMECVIRPRSGISFKSGLEAIIGTIDSDYRGEVKVILKNTTDMTVNINVNDRIAQAVFQYKINNPIEFVKEVKFNTERNENGFGSSGQ
jgi:dUTP pyrophosphatase